MKLLKLTDHEGQLFYRIAMVCPCGNDQVAIRSTDRFYPGKMPRRWIAGVLRCMRARMRYQMRQHLAASKGDSQITLDLRA